MNFLKIISVFIGLSQATLCFGSGLKWDQSRIDVEVGLGDKFVEVTYGFTNISNDTITIIGTRTSCGCTVPRFKKTVFMPDEKGSVVLKFDIGDRSGKQLKRVQVITDEDESENKYNLQLGADIPQKIIQTPKVLVWKTTGKALPKEVNVIFHKDFPVVLTSLLLNNKDAKLFDYEIVENAKGHNYTIRLTPKDTNVRARGKFALCGDDNKKQKELSKQQIYAFIR